MATVIDHLRTVPLFQGMTDRALEAVAGLGREVEFADGETVTREGDEGDAFYVVTAGRVAISRGDRTIRELGTGDFLGEISLIDGRPRTATATAVGARSTRVCIDRPAFLELMDRYGAVRLGILMALTDRIRRDAGSASD